MLFFVGVLEIAYNPSHHVLLNLLTGPEIFFRKNYSKLLISRAASPLLFGGGGHLGTTFSIIYQIKAYHLSCSETFVPIAASCGDPRNRMFPWQPIFD